MKKRLTISISKQSLDYVERSVGKRGTSRSAVVESFIRESLERRREERLARLAKEFFAQPESQEETEAKDDWLKASMETQKRDD